MGRRRPSGRRQFWARVHAHLDELSAGLAIGAVWAAWHVIPWAQTGNGPAQIVALGTYTIAFRGVLARIVTMAGGSMWPAAVSHACYNLAWSLAPGAGKQYHPWIAARLAVALAAGLSLARRSGDRPDA